MDIDEGIEPTKMKLFLQAYIKFLRNKKVMENLQYLINSCAEKEHPQMEQKDLNNIYKNKRRTGWEMCLTAQIGEFEMDQDILDLGSDANVIPKKTWNKVGEPKLEWPAIQLCMANQ